MQNGPWHLCWACATRYGLASLQPVTMVSLSPGTGEGAGQGKLACLLIANNSPSQSLCYPATYCQSFSRHGGGMQPVSCQGLCRQLDWHCLALWSCVPGTVGAQQKQCTLSVVECVAGLVYGSQINWGGALAMHDEDDCVSSGPKCERDWLHCRVFVWGARSGRAQLPPFPEPTHQGKRNKLGANYDSCLVDFTSEESRKNALPMVSSTSCRQTPGSYVLACEIWSQGADVIHTLENKSMPHNARSLAAQCMNHLVLCWYGY